LLTLIRNVRAKRTHEWAKSGYNLGEHFIFSNPDFGCTMQIFNFVKVLFSPIVFGLGFIGPLSAEIITALEISLPIGTPLYWGLLIGGLLGLMAQVRGSWIWVKPS
jgi:hypothetical protein